MAAIRTAAGRTAVGRVRRTNEDALLVGHTVFAVADGMGGHRAGDLAAATAIAAVTPLDDAPLQEPGAARTALCDAVTRAHHDVAGLAARDPAHLGMGTTLTVACLVPSAVLVAHVGDSRAYLWHGGDLRQLTTDHTEVQELLDEGALTRRQADASPRSHLLTRAIGGSAEPHVDLLDVCVGPGDLLLLCSDGLTGPVDDAAIADAVRDGDHAAAVTDRLVHLALLAGGPDNVTALAVKF